MVEAFVIYFLQFTGVLVIATGVAVESVYTNFTSFVDEQFYSPTLMFIAVGVITLAIATFGFIGTFRESALLINIVSERTGEDVLVGFKFLNFSTAEY